MYEDNKEECNNHGLILIETCFDAGDKVWQTLDVERGRAGGF